MSEQLLGPPGHSKVVADVGSDDDSHDAYSDKASIDVVGPPSVLPWACSIDVAGPPLVLPGASSIDAVGPLSLLPTWSAHHSWHFHLLHINEPHRGLELKN